MIRRHLMALRVALMLGDGITAVLVFLIVSLVRFGDGEAAQAWRRLGLDLRAVAILFALVWVSALWSQGLYELRARWRFLTEARDILRTTFVVLVLALASLFALNQDNVSRLFLVLLFVTQPVLTMATRAALRSMFGVMRRRGRNMRFMVIVGTGTLAEEFANTIERRSVLGLRVIGHLTVPDEADRGVSRPTLGSVDEIETIFHSQIVDEVAICLPPRAGHWLEPVAELATEEGKTVRVLLDPVVGLLPVAHQEEFDGFLVRSFVHDGPHETQLLAKRLLDLVGSAVAIIAVSPLLLGIALAIRLRDGSPILFRQTRIGLHGRPFTIHKFRTMVIDAEARMSEVAELNVRRGPAFKADRDPRATALGSALRRSSLDELPQLWDVLRGQMSLVGPRPPLAVEVAAYDIWHRCRRLSVRPGITGLWQVEARGEPDFDRWVERDLAYIDHWSLGLDLKILLRMVPAVLDRTGR